MMKKFLLMLMAILSLAPSAMASYVTMAQFDINGDGKEEIIRTEGVGEKTAIKIYEGITDSYFYKPAATIFVPGQIVQVPSVSDFTNDGVLDLYFATGSDIGIIYYDIVEQAYKRKNEIDERLQDPYRVSTDYTGKRQAEDKKESAILLHMEEAKKNENKDTAPTNANTNVNNEQKHSEIVTI